MVLWFIFKVYIIKDLFYKYLIIGFKDIELIYK